MILSYRGTSGVTLYLALLLSAAGCPGGTASRPPSSGNVVSAEPRKANAVFASHPFAYFHYTAPEQTSAIDIASCFSLALHVPSFRTGEALSGQLLAQNTCGQPVAVLTAPIEQRLRLVPETRFPVEAGIDKVYAVAYFFRRDVGLGRDAFRGDGGVTPSGLPDYVVVEESAAMAVPITSGVPVDLEPGAYGLAFFTIVAPAPSHTHKDGQIDLQNSVARFAGFSEGSGQVVLPPGSARLAPVAFFKVTAP